MKADVSERQRVKLLADMIGYYRLCCPRIGGFKLFHLLEKNLGHAVTLGRDSFLKVYESKGFKLNPNKRRRTTDSNHVYKRYPNLIKGKDARYSNHIWVSDITYVWMAIRIAGGGNLCGTIHHSDRGSQYASEAYVSCLMEHHIRISMTEGYEPTDNAMAERQNGIFKVEWIYEQEMYRDKEQAINEINRMIDFYNNRRPHMSIGMECPMEVYKGKLPGKNLWRKRP